MSKKTNWGILSTGNIAGKFATDLQSLPNANLYAVGSRSLKKAKAFAKQYKITKSYGSYKALLKDPNLDVVYIATPHNLHCENTLMALDNRVAVLCEKPLAINGRQVQQMVQKAKQTNTFLMEALWTLFLPHLLKTKALINAGSIGAVQSIKADFGFCADFDPKSRLFDPNLGGGALLDIGIYPLLLAQAILGSPTDIRASAILGKTKVDEDLGILLKYEGDKVAHLHASLRSRTSTEAFIYGTKGYLHIPTQWFKPVSAITHVAYKGLKTTKYLMPQQAIGYKYEAAAVMDCLNKGQKECSIVPLSFSINLMKTMDEIRKQIGVVYAVD